MTVWLALFEPGQIKLVWLERKKGLWVGLQALVDHFFGLRLLRFKTLLT